MKARLAFLLFCSVGLAGSPPSGRITFESFRVEAMPESPGPVIAHRVFRARFKVPRLFRCRIRRIELRGELDLVDGGEASLQLSIWAPGELHAQQRILSLAWRGEERGRFRVHTETSPWTSCATQPEAREFFLKARLGLRHNGGTEKIGIGLDRAEWGPRGSEIVCRPCEGADENQNRR